MAVVVQEFIHAANFFFDSNFFRNLQLQQQRMALGVFYFLQNTAGICGKVETMPEPMALGSNLAVVLVEESMQPLSFDFFSFLGLQLQQQDAFNIFIFKIRLVSVEKQKPCRNRWH